MWSCIIGSEDVRVLLSEMTIIDLILLNMIVGQYLLAIASTKDFIVHAQVVVHAFFAILSFATLPASWALAVTFLGWKSLAVEVLLCEGSATG